MNAVSVLTEEADARGLLLEHVGAAERVFERLDEGEGRRAREKHQERLGGRGPIWWLRN